MNLHRKMIEKAERRIANFKNNMRRTYGPRRFWPSQVIDRYEELKGKARARRLNRGGAHG